MYFDSWQDILRVALLGTLTYIALILLLRISGKRTLSKWNAFDFVVTIALGSTLATVLLSEQVSLFEGVAALALLVLLQFVVSWLSLNVPWVRQLVKAQPSCLYGQGGYISHALKRERVTEAEVRAAVRGAGLASMEDVEAVVLETDGSVSVLRRTGSGGSSALIDVR